jgi:tripartite-type tricarboxylate transporter receptor subunit TctC
MRKLLILLLFAALPALAQPWPAKPVRIIVPNGPGGVTDLIARFYCDQLARAVGQPCLIDNRAGGDGLIGAAAAGRSAPDGYNLFIVSQSFVAIDPHLHASMPVDPARDFVALAVLIDITPIAVAVNVGVPVNNIPELVALAKAQPGKLSYGVTVPIVGMVGQWLNRRAGIDLLEVSYKTTAQQITDTVSGVIPISLSTVGTFEPMVRAGKLRLIAVTSPVRVPGWESVASIMETYPDLDVGGGIVLLAPAGFPPAIAQRLNRESDAIVRSPEYVQRAREFGWANLNGARSLAGVADYIRTERERWGRIVKELGIQPK